MRAAAPLPGLVTGVRESGPLLRAWQRDPLAVVGPWAYVSLLISAALLLAIWLIALASAPDPTPMLLPGLHTEATPALVVDVVLRNGLVLALHAMACVAGYLAGYTMPREADAYGGWLRRVHDAARPLAFAFVTGATLFSLCTQAFVLGGSLSTLAAQLGLSPAVLVLGVLPHALPELVAVFLPLGAWLFAARAQAWRELFAATAVTVALAVPLLVLAASIEVWVTPRVITALQFV